MATRSTISIFENNVFKAVYCHWDGYPSNNGKLLLEYYSNPEIINEIMELGNLSFLDISIEKPENHSYNTPVKGYSVFYGRDRGNTNSNHTVVHSLNELKNISDNWGAEFIYLFDTTQNKWFVSQNDSDTIDLLELTFDLIKEFESLGY